LDTFGKAFKAAFNDNENLRKTQGGGILGIKSQHQVELKQKALEREEFKKANL